jgi:SIT4-associating protein SAP185/190
VIAGVDDDAEGGSMFPNTDFTSGDANQTFSPTFPEPGFSPPDSLSTGSSEDGTDGHAEAVRRRFRVPLEVDDDDDEMGEMVAPSGTGLVDSDDEDEAIINESLGYSNLTGPARYSNFRRSHTVGSHFDDDDDEQNDSSDGEDDGLVEILVPGRKSSTSN